MEAEKLTLQKKRTALTQTIQAHDGGINIISYSPDGHLLASASSDNTIKYWNIVSGKLQQTLKGHTAWVNSLSYSHDGPLFASA